MFFKNKNKSSTVKSFSTWCWDYFFSNIRIAFFMLSLIYIGICIIRGKFWLDIKIDNNMSALDILVLILLAFPILYTISFLITAFYVKYKCKFTKSLMGFILNFSIDWNTETLRERLRLPSFSFTWDLKKKFYSGDTIRSRVSTCIVMLINYFIILLMLLVILCGIFNIYMLVKQFLL